MKKSICTFAVYTLTIQSPAVYDKDAAVNEKVKKECRVEQRVADDVQSAARGSFDITTAASPGSAGKVLWLTITDVGGVGGGTWSGPKSISLAGTLMDDGKVIGTFHARRTSSGGFWASGFISTCGILARDAKALGKDVHGWLENPSMDARLGELK
jgi:hypothetical protein